MTFQIIVLFEKHKIIRMKPSKIFYYWLSIFALNFFLFQFISEKIRPSYNGDSLLINYFLGIAPNFFPAIAIPALFLIIIPQLKLTNKWINNNQHVMANLISTTGLITWEFIQMSSTKLHFDWNDIIWTLIGASIFQLLWIASPKHV